MWLFSPSHQYQIFKHQNTGEVRGESIAVVYKFAGLSYYSRSAEIF